MGNTLVSFAPSAIHSVDEYLAALPDVQRESSLGSTRFLKTVKVRVAGCSYPLVAKVFVIHDASLPLHRHKKNIDRIRNALENCPNALPFSRAIILEKSAILLRQFVKYSLYDRVSTRPFLTFSEKKWIAFQLLCSLAQCHRAEVCHGDIKLENILVTGWNWVTLTDFASFKPTMLPMDNPTDFFFFFDTSRRQVCCVAPERFYKDRSQREELMEGPRAELCPAMDIFSLGCVLIELFTDGKYPFKLSDMYRYKEALDAEIPPQLQEITDDGIRELCAHMVQRDPLARFSADKYLEMCRTNCIFPACFFNGLLDYLKLFALDTAHHPDSRIFRLSRDHETFLDNMASEGEDVAVLALASFTTAMLRSLTHSAAKIAALRLMCTCSRQLAPSVVLDRLLPFMLHMLSDSSPAVVSEAIYVITQSLSLIETVPKADSFVFVEFILPELLKVSLHPRTLVRVALAANIGSLAETALRFLETSHLNCGDVSKGDVSSLLLYRSSYDRELLVLHEGVQNIVATLISDTSNQVKRMLLEKGSTRLCVFFGEERAHDVLLSHMITFLNDSVDHELRSAFYASVAGVAAFVGTSVTPILMPLIEQGLNDPHDAVVCSTLRCISALSDVQFFRRSVLCDLFEFSLRLLKRGNTWVWVETAHVLACIARNVPLSTRECRLRPVLSRYLAAPAAQIDRPEVILGCLAVTDFHSVDQETSTRCTTINGSRLHQVQHQLHQLNLTTGMSTTSITVPREPTSVCSGVVELSEQQCRAIPFIKTDVPVAEVAEEPKANDELCAAMQHWRRIKELLEWKKQLAGELLAWGGEQVEANDAHFSQSWKPKGALMAHLREHRSAINKISVLPESVFATCSSDGTVKLWDWARMEKRAMTNRSLYTYDRLTGHLIAMDYCAGERCIAVASNSGNMELFRIESALATGPQFISSRFLDPLDEGWVVEIKPAGESVVACASLYGGVFGWDLRSRGTAWRLNQDISKGLNVCMAVDNSHTWLVTGTTEGYVVCWDLRFYIAAKQQIQHPMKWRVCRLFIPRCAPNGLVWASHLTNNEVSLWNLESRQRSKTLWASPCPPFTDTKFSKDACYAICQADQNLFTAGSDMRIRCWDVSDGGYRNSCLISGSALDGNRIKATYSMTVCDGSEVIQETLSRIRATEKPEPQMGSRAAAGHHDSVSELGVLQTGRHFLVSASRNGVLKIWK